MKRLFIGIPIESEPAVRTTGTWRNDRQLNQNQLSWVKPENWHITLFFLGDTPKEKVDLLQQLIDDSFAQEQSFSTELKGVGVFPNLRNPKVLWLGLDNLHPLMPAHIRLGEMLRQNGFSFDNKPLKPHLTLARIRNLVHHASFQSFLKKYQPVDCGAVTINRVVLFESILTPKGPIYKPLFVKELV